MLAKKAGWAVMDLVKKNVLSRDIMTLEAFENAIAVDMAIGGSTNTVLHLPAIAHEAGVDLSLDLFDEISRKARYITKMSPGGSYHMQDLDEAGGISAVMKELTKIGLIHTDCLTVTGPLKDRLAHAFVENHEVIHDIDNAYMNKGGIAILKGNLAPLGSVIKESAVEKELLTYEGTAKCYDSEEAAIKAITGGEIKEGHVVVIRYEGPKAARVCGKCSTPQPSLQVWAQGCSPDGRPLLRSQPRCLRRPHFPGSHGRRSHRPCQRWGQDPRRRSESPTRAAG